MVRKLRDYRLYLEDIFESIKKIKNYTKGMSFDEFAKDEKTIDAVVRNFEIIGEASKQLPREIKDKHSEIEWKATTDFRNVIIHEYFGIDLKIMWDIIKNELPPLEGKLKHLHRAFKKKSS